MCIGCFLVGVCVGCLGKVETVQARAVNAKMGEYRVDQATGRTYFVFGCSVAGCPNRVPADGTDVPKGN